MLVPLLVSRPLRNLLLGPVTVSVPLLVRPAVPPLMKPLAHRLLLVTVSVAWKVIVAPQVVSRTSPATVPTKALSTKEFRLPAASLKIAMSPGPGTTLLNQLFGLLQFRSTPLAPLQTIWVPTPPTLAAPWTVVC